MTGVAAQYLWPGFEDLKLKEPLRTPHTAFQEMMRICWEGEWEGKVEGGGNSL